MKYKIYFKVCNAMCKIALHTLKYILINKKNWKKTSSNLENSFRKFP